MQVEARKLCLIVKNPLVRLILLVLDVFDYWNSLLYLCLYYDNEIVLLAKEWFMFLEILKREDVQSFYLKNND